MKTKQYSRISIIGISATGKSTVARKLNKITNVPIIYCDTLRWSENWLENDEKYVITEISKLLKTPEWIFEGYINPLAFQRLEVSDVIIYLDYSGMFSAFQYVKRYFKNNKVKREELPDGCLDTFTFSMLKTILLRAERKEIEKEIIGFESKVIRIRSPKQLSGYIKTLRDNI